MVDRTAGLCDSLPPDDKQEPGTQRPRAESGERFLHVASTDNYELDRIITPKERLFLEFTRTYVDLWLAADISCNIERTSLGVLEWSTRYDCFVVRRPSTMMTCRS